MYYNFKIRVAHLDQFCKKILISGLHRVILVFDSLFERLALVLGPSSIIRIRTIEACKTGDKFELILSG